MELLKVTDCMICVYLSNGMMLQEIPQRGNQLCSLGFVVSDQILSLILTKIFDLYSNVKNSPKMGHFHRFMACCPVLQIKVSG